MYNRKFYNVFIAGSERVFVFTVRYYEHGNGKHKVLTFFDDLEPSPNIISFLMAVEITNTKIIILAQRHYEYLSPKL